MKYSVILSKDNKKRYPPANQSKMAKSRPSYKEMCTEAILAVNQRGGTSLQVRTIPHHPHHLHLRTRVHAGIVLGRCMQRRPSAAS